MRGLTEGSWEMRVDSPPAVDDDDEDDAIVLFFLFEGMDGEE